MQTVVNMKKVKEKTKKIKNIKAQLKIQAHKNYTRFLVPRFSTRSQLKIQEMAFMLIAVVIFFALAGMFFLVIVYRGMIEQANTFEKEKAVSTVVNIANTPEFSCGESLCMDADKLMAMQNRPAYKGFWPITSFVVTKISKDTEIIPCTEKTYPNCNFFEVYKEEVESEEGVETFASLCRKEVINGFIYNKCELARIIIGFKLRSPEQ
jgi:hypothetical protein